MHRIVSTEPALEITRVIDAPCDLVFAAWTKAEHLVQWFGPKDFTVSEYTMNAREGGNYRFVMRSPEGKLHPVYGVYLEITPPERIVFTWEREDEEGKDGSGTVVTVTLEPLGRQTKLTLHQAKFRSAEGRDSHFGGWTECLERLAAYAERLAA